MLIAGAVLVYKNPDAAASTTLINDNFNRADNVTVGGGWTEVEASGATAAIFSNRLRFTSNDAARRPIVKQAFTAQNSGLLTMDLDYDFDRESTEGIYAVHMQLGSGMSDADLSTGIAAALVWGRWDTSNGTHERLGYINSAGTIVEFASFSGDSDATIQHISISVDIAAKTYNIIVTNSVAANTYGPFAFRTSSVSSISEVRLLTDGLNTTYFPNYRSIDNVQVVHTAPPVANFTATPTTGTAPLTVNFTNTTNGDGLAPTYRWDFHNDGNFDSTLESPSYEYLSPGVYTVVLEATTPAGQSTSTQTNLITVSPPPTCDTSFPINTFRVCYYDEGSQAGLDAITPPTLPGGAVFLAEQSTTTIPAGVGTRYPAYSMNWGTGAVTPTTESQYLYAVHRGNIDFAQGSYVFQASSDDGTSLFVNGIQTISDWNQHGIQTKYSATTTLSGPTDIEWWYREDYGDAILNFGWTRYNACEDGIDNDSDGLSDILDPGCTSSSDNEESNAIPSTFSNGQRIVVGVVSADLFPIDGGDLSPIESMVPIWSQAQNAKGAINLGTPAYGFTGVPSYGGGAWYWRVNFDSGGDGWIKAGDLTAAVACNDGSDNDTDGLTDYPSDPGCSSSADTDEANAAAVPPSVIGTPISAGAGTGSGTPTGSVSIPSVSVPVASGRLLIVSTAAEDASSSDCVVSGVTYGAQSLTRVTSATQQVGTNPYLCTETWYLLDPSSTTATVSVTFSGNVNYAVAGAIALQDANQSIPTPVNKSADGSDPVTSILTTSSATGSNILLVDVAAGGEGQTLTPSQGSQTSRWSRIQGGSGGMTAGASTRILSVGNAMGWSAAANVRRMAQIIIAVQPLVGGSGGGGSSACSDGLDNDNDTYIDLNDPGCFSLTDNDETDIAASTNACSDGIDNDGDGYIDAGDPGCLSASHNSELNRVSRTFNPGDRVIVNPPASGYYTVVLYAGDYPTPSLGCEVINGQGDCDGNMFDHDPPGNPYGGELGVVSASTPVYYDKRNPSTPEYNMGSWYSEVDLQNPVFPLGYMVENGLRLAAQCEDGLDNDNDGKIDYGTGMGNDPDCSTLSDQSESNPPHNLTGWAWSEYIGWISFADPSGGTGIDYGVDIDIETGKLSGQAWSENIGWISFDEADLGGCPKAPCEALVATTTGKVTGWARACLGTYTSSNEISGTCATSASRADGWDGWISLSKQANETIEYGVTVSGCNYSGWAWGGDVIGWISFSGNEYSTLQYGVTGVGDGCLTPYERVLSCSWTHDPANGQYVLDLLGPELEGLNDNQKKTQTLSVTSDRFLNSRYQSTNPSATNLAATTSIYNFPDPIPAGYYDIWLSIYDKHEYIEPIELNESAYLNLYSNGQSTLADKSAAIYDIQDTLTLMFKIDSKVDANKYINQTIDSAQFVHALYPDTTQPFTPSGSDNDFWVLCAMLREVGPSFEIKLSPVSGAPTTLAVVKPTDEPTGNWKSNVLTFDVQRNGGFTGGINYIIDDIYVKCVDDDEWCLDAEGEVLTPMPQATPDYDVTFANGTSSGYMGSGDTSDELAITIVGNVLPGRYGVKLKGYDASCTNPDSCPNQDTIDIDLEVRPDKLYTPR